MTKEMTVPQTEALNLDNLDRTRVYVVRENTLDMAVHLVTFWHEAKNRWAQEYADCVAPEIMAKLSPENRAIVMRAARANLGLECEKSAKSGCSSCQGGSCSDCSSCE